MKTYHPYTNERVDNMLRRHSNSSLVSSIILVVLFLISSLLVCNNYYSDIVVLKSVGSKILFVFFMFIFFGALLIPEIIGYNVGKNPSMITVEMAIYFTYIILHFATIIALNMPECLFPELIAYYIIRLYFGFKIKKWVDLGMPYEQPAYYYQYKYNA